jgi:ribosomal protein S18 acetylase RimI-like enzyme
MKHEIEIAKPNDLVAINNLFETCKADLLQKDIFQWDDQYPNKEYFKGTIHDNETYVLKKGSEILAAAVIDEWQSPEWDHVKWSKPNGTYLIVHSFCVHPNAEGLGYGSKMMEFIEELAYKQGYTGIRLDAFSENQRALTFYEKRGYTKKGEVFFSSKPLNHETYYCYEKLF